ncbi:MAG: hypothetical protein WD512_00800 [Candidatus Paceibacterota bacterium]
MNDQTIGFGGMVLTILCVFCLFLTLIGSITGSLWVSKVASENLQDTYNIVLYSVGSDKNQLKNYILSNNQNTLNNAQIDMVLNNTPAIIFKNITGANSNKIISEMRAMGAIVDAV